MKKKKPFGDEIALMDSETGSEIHPMSSRFERRISAKKETGKAEIKNEKRRGKD